jgi:hypothetical protein
MTPSRGERTSTRAGGDLVVAEPPRPQRALGAIDRDAVGLDVTPRLHERPLGDAAGAVGVFELAERQLVGAQLGDGVHQLALLLAEVLAPDDREQVALAHPVAVAQRPRRVAGGVRLRRRLAQRRHLAGEARVDAGQAIAVQRQRALERR